jgi:hypothetical protein
MTGVPSETPIPNQTESQLRERLRQHMVDRNFQDATLGIYKTTLELATMVRGGVAERRDAYKWVAALSTGAFFFVGQALPRGGVMMFADYRWLLMAEVAFGLSVLGAAGYLLTVDTRAAAWLRDIHRHTARVTSALTSMDANAMSMRDTLEAGEIVAANDAFRDTYRDKLALGKAMADPPAEMPLPGRRGIVFEWLCIGGLLSGVGFVGLDLLYRVSV